MNCSLPGSSVHGIFQSRILEWVAISFSRGSSQPRSQFHVFFISCIVRWFFTTVPPGKPISNLQFSGWQHTWAPSPEHPPVVWGVFWAHLGMFWSMVAPAPALCSDNGLTASAPARSSRPLGEELLSQWESSCDAFSNCSPAVGQQVLGYCYMSHTPNCITNTNFYLISQLPLLFLRHLHSQFGGSYSLSVLIHRQIQALVVGAAARLAPGPCDLFSHPGPPVQRRVLCLALGSVAILKYMNNFRMQGPAFSFLHCVLQVRVLVSLFFFFLTWLVDCLLVYPLSHIRYFVTPWAV